MRGYFAEDRTPWQGASGDVENGIGTDDSKGACIGFHLTQDVITSEKISPCLSSGNPVTGQASIGVAYGFPLGFRPENVRMYEETATTLCNGTRAGFCNGVVVGVDLYNQTTTGMVSKTLNSVRSDADHTPVVCIQDSTENKKQNGRGWCEDTAYTLDTFSRPAVVYAVDQGGGKSSCNVSENKSPTLTCTHGGEPVVLDRAFYNQGENALYDPQHYTDGTVPALVAKGPSAVAYEGEVQYIVRRLTPTECARLQGFPDKWGHPDKKSELTDEEYKFWFEVRKTDAEINGKQVKEWTKPQILAWYNKLHTDSSEYKMWGNGIALPNALYVMQGIAEVLQRG